MPRPRIHQVNESRFSSIETEEDAYWLGFFTADGNINKNIARISLAKRDSDHLYKFKEYMEYTGPVIIDDKKCHINICSKAIIQNLSLIGIKERKTFTVTPWHGYQSLLRHYWRGLLDGDGNIYKNRSGNNNVPWTTELSGNIYIIQGYRNFLLNNECKYKVAIKPRKSIYVIRVGGIRGSKWIASLLYGNSTVYLDRKYRLAKELIDIDLTPSKFENVSEQEMLDLYIKHGTWNNVAQIMGWSTSGISKHKRRLGILKTRNGTVLNERIRSAL